MTTTTPRAAWGLILAASAILMITMAARLTTGLWMWYADIVLALLAAVVNLPIRESVPHIAAAQA
jgi:hypothetical protein